MNVLPAIKSGHSGKRGGVGWPRRYQARLGYGQSSSEHIAALLLAAAVAAAAGLILWPKRAPSSRPKPTKINTSRLILYTKLIGNAGGPDQKAFKKNICPQRLTSVHRSDGSTDEGTRGVSSSAGWLPRETLMQKTARTGTGRKHAHAPPPRSWCLPFVAHPHAFSSSCPWTSSGCRRGGAGPDLENRSGRAAWTKTIGEGGISGACV